MRKVNFRDWEFQVNYELTKETYKNVLGGNSKVGCGCMLCKNYRQQIENVFPEEVKSLFDKLGIDYRKESEVYEIVKLENGLHNYGGWFHFAGNILSGKMCKTENSNVFEFTQLMKSFPLIFQKTNR